METRDRLTISRKLTQFHGTRGMALLDAALKKKLPTPQRSWSGGAEPEKVISQREDTASLLPPSRFFRLDRAEQDKISWKEDTTSLSPPSQLPGSGRAEPDKISQRKDTASLSPPSQFLGEWNLSENSSDSEPVSSGSSWDPDSSDEKQSSDTSDEDEIDTNRVPMCAMNFDIVMNSDTDSDSVDFPVLRDFVQKQKGNFDTEQGCDMEVTAGSVEEGRVSVQSVEEGGGVSVQSVEEGGVSGQCVQGGGVSVQPDEEGGVSVQCVEGGKYKWNKKHACKYCEKIVLQMSKHLSSCHKNEPEVARILAMEKGSNDRRQAWIALQDEGDYLHNVSVLENKSGFVIPKYRASSKSDSDVDIFIACSHCKGLFRKALISVHSKHCHKNPKLGQSVQRGEAARLGRLMLPIPLDVSSAFFHTVLAKLRADDVSHLVKGDCLILEYGRRLFEKRDVEEHAAGQINTKMRELGRLLQIIKKQSKMTLSALNDVIDASSFNVLVSSVKELAAFDDATHQFRKGSLAMRLGHALKKCSQIKKSEAIKRLGQGSDEKWQNQLDQAERFDRVFSGDWYDSISASASQSLGRERMNKPKLIPSCTDVEKVMSLLENKMDAADYPTVVKATLCAVSVFNRKRGGELQRMKVEDFRRSKVGPTTNADLLKGLTETEKKMVNYFHRVEIRGKFNRPVPILLTKKMKESLERILSMRNDMTEHHLQHAQYVFATPTGTRPYRGHDVLKQFALEVEVSNPAIFTFTQLRKQVATLAQAMAISKLDQDQLADFLGHDIRVHRHIYRQPQEILQKAKVAKILMSVNSGLKDFDTCIQKEISDEVIDFDDVDKESEGHLHSDSDTVDDDYDEDGAPVKKKAKRSKNPEHESADITVTKRVCDPVKKRSQKVRKPWTTVEKNAVDRYFDSCAVLRRLPGKREIEQVIISEPVLKNRSWTNIKDYIRNRFLKETKSH